MDAAVCQVSDRALPMPLLYTSPSTQGIGPATGSAILQAYNPHVPFASDEAMKASLGKAEYTPAAVLKLTRALGDKAKELAKDSNKGTGTCC